MTDYISRQAAIDAIRESTKKYKGFLEMEQYTDDDAIDAIKSLPSAQPERLTDDDFETIRIHLNALKEELCNQHRWKEAEDYQRIIDRFMVFASADVREVVHGDSIGELDPRDQFVCSVCGIELQGWVEVERDEDDGEETFHEYMFRYCPNCGAKMEGET